MQICLRFYSPFALATSVGRVALVLTTLASALSAATIATTTAASTAHAEVGGIVLVLPIIPLGVVLHSIARRAALKIWALLDMGEDVLTAIIWGDEAEPLILEELLDCSGRRHFEAQLTATRLKR